jgi:hypothetical protein
MVQAEELIQQPLWRRYEYLVGGDAKRVVSFEAKRLNALTAAPFKRAMAKARQAYVAVMPEREAGRLIEIIEVVKAEFVRLKTADATAVAAAAAPDSTIASLMSEHRSLQRRDAEAKAAFFETLDEDVLRNLFRRAVRSITMTVDGTAITSTDEMLEVADPDLLFFVIRTIEARCSLSAEEGKGSASPSTSSPATTGGNGASPAPSTESEAGPTSTTATETRSTT